MLKFYTTPMPGPTDAEYQRIRSVSRESVFPDLPPRSHRPRFNPDFENFKIGAKSASFGRVVVPPDSNRHQFGIENISGQKFQHAQIFLPISKIVPKSAHLGVPRTKSSLFVVSKSVLFRRSYLGDEPRITPMHYEYFSILADELRRDTRLASRATPTYTE